VLCFAALLLPALEIYANESNKTQENVSTTKRVYHLTHKSDQETQLSELVKHIDNPALSQLLAKIALKPIDISGIIELHESRQALFSHAQQRLANTEEPLNTEEAGVLILALSLVKDDEALNFIAQMGIRFYQETGFTQQLLYTLRDLPVNDQIQSYVDNLLEHGRDKPELVRSALLYYAAVEHPAAMRWAAYYRTPGIDPKVRFSGLYLASILSKDTAVAQWILDDLSRQPPVPTYQQYYLLRAYQRQVDGAEFNHFATKFSVAPSVLKQTQLENEFLIADHELKPSLVKYLLNSPHYEQQRMALLSWLQEGKLLENWTYLDTDKRLLAIRLANKNNIRLFPAQVQETDESGKTDNSKYYLLSVFVLIALAIMTTVRFMFNRNNTESFEDESKKNQVVANQ